MVLSDPGVADGRNTIATFSATKKTLRDYSDFYIGKVDLRVKKARAKAS